jgi:hypothetical protein
MNASFSISREALTADYRRFHVWGDDAFIIPGSPDAEFQDERLDPQGISVIMKSTLKKFLREFCTA